MAFTFDLEGAVNQIATLEGAMSTATVSVQNAYTFNNNPADITDPSDLPAVVHMHRGPLTLREGPIPGHLTVDTWQVSYDIESILLCIESVPTEFPSDEGVANLFFDAILETFMNRSNLSTLVTAASAQSYALILGSPSYGLRAWPPVEPPIKAYWAYTYTHRFTFTGGG